jgi:hypothetical protein
MTQEGSSDCSCQREASYFARRYHGTLVPFVPTQKQAGGLQQFIKSSSLDRRVSSKKAEPPASQEGTRPKHCPCRITWGVVEQDSTRKLYERGCVLLSFSEGGRFIPVHLEPDSDGDKARAKVRMSHKSNCAKRGPQSPGPLRDGRLVSCLTYLVGQSEEVQNHSQMRPQANRTIDQQGSLLTTQLRASFPC